MARIPEAEIRRLKKDVSLERLCTRYGIELKPRGRNLVGFCPWHKDTTASLVVTPSNNLWHCMGECNEGGDTFKMVMKAENVSFRRAHEVLCELSGTSPGASTLRTRAGTTHPILVQPGEVSDTELFNHVVDFYHTAFQNDPKAMEYLHRRHCLHPEAVKHFKLGYANRTLGYRVPVTTASGKRLKARLQGLGILRRSGHEHLNGSVVFPIFDAAGNPVQMYGRKITDNLRKGTPQHLYLEQPMGGVWNGEALESQREWILCEALIDALSCWRYDLRHVTAAYGKGNFTADHWALVRRVRPQKIIIAYDNDPAGNKAAAALAPKLAAEGVDVHRAPVPHGSDINDYVTALVRKNPRTVSDTLRAFFDTAALVCRAEPGNTSVTVGEVRPTEGESSRAPARASSSILEAAPISAAAAPAEPVVPAVESAADEKSSSECGPIVTHTPGGDVELTIGTRSYRVRGLAKNHAYEVLKINLRAMSAESFHVDTLDLYNARHRTTFINSAADELRVGPEVVKRDLGRVLLKLEELQDAQISKALEPKQTEPASMSVQERQEAEALLKDPELMERLVVDLDACGLVGERIGKQTCFLAAVSRRLDEPLAVIIQSSSAAGKSTLMNAILALVPEEDCIQYSAMAGQSLFYLGDTNLKHKILAIVEEEGVKQASYALKLLQSEGELTIASTGKDPTTGRMVTQEYRVEGPVQLLTSTTAADIEEELLNRCIVLTVDETREQTQAIHRRQRRGETLEGVLEKIDRDHIRRLWQNAQRLLEPVRVINPFADELTFLDDNTRTRRDHKKYLTLIRTIAFLHQYQRPTGSTMHRGVPVKYIEVIPADIQLANTSAAAVLGRSLDELPPQTRRLLGLVKQMVSEACAAEQIPQNTYRFSRRRIREYTGWGNTQLKVHLHGLEEME